MDKRYMILAPLRGVTVRTFREVFAPQLAEAGFNPAVAPFVSAIGGNLSAKMVKDLMRQLGENGAPGTLPLVPQAIGKDPGALRELLRAFKDLGFEYADLNAGCPFPMIRNKGRGSGLIKTPDVLARMLEVGVEEMGERRFSLKIRLGIERPDELEKIMPLINRFPLAMLTIHARTARAMYEGEVDIEHFRRAAALSANPVIYNGDIKIPFDSPVVDGVAGFMVGRGFVGSLGMRDDSCELLKRYIRATEIELSGRGAVLGRVKELLSYWRDYSPFWRRKWNEIKLCRTVDELWMVVNAISAKAVVYGA